MTIGNAVNSMDVMSRESTFFFYREYYKIVKNPSKNIPNHKSKTHLLKIHTVSCVFLYFVSKYDEIGAIHFTPLCFHCSPGVDSNSNRPHPINFDSLSQNS